MFIGHLPAGYLITCTLMKRLPLIARHARWAMVIGLLGAVAPDFDLFWCYLVDNGQRHHHLYPSHWPLLWFALLAATVCFGALRGVLIVAAILFFLDSFTGVSKSEDWSKSQLIPQFSFIIRWFFDYLQSSSSFLPRA